MGGSAANVRSMRAIGQLCQDAGLRVMEASGWADRGRTWGTLVPEYVVCHHTAATVDIDRVLIDGRADLPGPLCNFALHGDGAVILIASGLANHAGVASVSSTRAYGIEATGPIPSTAAGVSAFPQYGEYLTLCAAIRLHHGWPAGRVIAHKEIAQPDGRKPDPAFGSRAPAPYPDMDAFRAAVERQVRTWGLEDDVTKQEYVDALAAERPKLAAAIADAVAAKLTPALSTELEPAIQRFTGSPHVFIRRPGDAAIYVVTAAGPIHVPNPAVFAGLSGAEDITALTIEVPADDPVWS